MGPHKSVKPSAAARGGGTSCAPDCLPLQQECIPVGCVPSVCCSGRLRRVEECLSRGVSAWGVSARFGDHHCNWLSSNQRPCCNDIPPDAMMTGSKRSRPISDADGIRDNNDWMFSICKIINPASFCQYP